MKLNIGCGLSYRKGYVNIDAFNDTVADNMMSVVNMDFDDNVFTQVDCIQVIEHLGAAKSIYALSEIHRVLRPGGRFLLETPDLHHSFKSFLKGNEERRKLIMNWIFGLDTPGLSHRYGFPEELLKTMLHEAGFVDIEVNHINSKSVNPKLRAECRKASSITHQRISRFRRCLVREGLVDLEQQVESLEKEVLVQELIDIISDPHQRLDAKHLHRILDVSVCCPRIGLSFLRIITEESLVDAEETKRHVETLRELDQIGFVKVLVHLFKEMPLLAGRQEGAILLLRSMVSKSITKMLSGNRKAIDGFRSRAGGAESSMEFDYFSPTMLQELSSKSLALGIKAFALDKMDEAEVHLLDAVRLNRDSVLGYWNIGRIYAAQEREAEAFRCLESARSLLLLRDPRRSRDLVRRVDGDIKSVREGRLRRVADPILTLD